MPLDEVTVDEIRQAKRALDQSERKSPWPRQGKLKKISIRVAEGQFWLGAVPLEALPDLVRALARVKLPTHGRYDDVVPTHDDVVAASYSPSRLRAIRIILLIGDPQWRPRAGRLR